jgi:hypothetical protein
VKPAAIEPLWNPAKVRFETSTHRTEGLEASAIWAIGYEYVEGPGRRVRARGHCEAMAMTGQGLALDVNGPPYPRHVDVVGWPDSEDERLLKAIEIAEKMTLELDPRP